MTNSPQKYLGFKMSIFEFDDSSFLGKIRAVDTRKITIHVDKDDDLKKAIVGRLVAVKVDGPVDVWLIGIIDKILKTVTSGNNPDKNNVDSAENNDEQKETHEEYPVNTVFSTLIGTVRWNASGGGRSFSRSLAQIPGIDADCYVLKDKHLESFMNILSSEGGKEQSLEFGRYVIDNKAIAYLDGNKLFQRHAALLGSTGSGKSWTVASILERAAVLPSSNLIVFDLHGEYSKLSYARHLRIPGPEDLGKSTNELLYLPYWLLNAEEMQAMFIDRSEFSAHNQVMAFQDAVIRQKKKTLEDLKKKEILEAFTLDSPVPFSIENVFKEINDLNDEMEQGARGLKQGKFYGQFSRLLVRLRSKMNDRRYGFLFMAPLEEHSYESMALTAKKLMDYQGENARIKVIDFSEVPAEILPVIVGLVARLIYEIQFWTNHDNRRPVALACDEAHQYLPKASNDNPNERRAIEVFEKIAKEGRKYGVSLFIVSQRPSDVSPTVLSQCNNVIALRLTNADDQNTVRKMMPESLESLLEMLPIMDIGEALVVGDAVLLPSRIYVNTPKEEPLSATIDFWTKWRETTIEPDLAHSVENMRKQGRN
ncbi:MAG: ATP-binding protein [Chitinispirillaceae bacterium]|nr:ATP-binding protein [Chitinispirillaceae bacterium]